MADSFKQNSSGVTEKVPRRDDPEHPHTTNSKQAENDNEEATDHQVIPAAAPPPNAAPLKKKPKLDVQVDVSHEYWRELFSSGSIGKTTIPEMKKFRKLFSRSVKLR